MHVVGPDGLDEFIQKIQPAWPKDSLRPEEFLAEAAYRPLPTLVQAARELFHHGRLWRIERAAASTDQAVEAISSVVHEAARTKTRHLVLLTGAPGAGKTLVGLRVVHAHFLDDLAEARSEGKPTTPAVFLSGNAPLVSVLQYELRGAGGGGKTFVRDVKNYVARYSGRRQMIPPEHVLVFDEAQRAWDAQRVQATHNDPNARSEPEHFIEFADRIPSWCVVVGLIGGGQEIHVGEEGGLAQWRRAVEGSAHPESWTVHMPEHLQPVFVGTKVKQRSTPHLNLDTQIRFHLATELHEYVGGLLNHDTPVERQHSLHQVGSDRRRAPSTAGRAHPSRFEVLASAGSAQPAPAAKPMVGKDRASPDGHGALFASGAFAEVLRAFDKWASSQDDENFETVCLLLAGDLPAVQAPQEINRISTLPDGSRIVMTTRAGHDNLSGLRGPLTHWVDGHGDARGVLAFRESLFDSVSQAASYDAAVEQIGSKGSTSGVPVAGSERLAIHGDGEQRVLSAFAFFLAQDVGVKLKGESRRMPAVSRDARVPPRIQWRPSVRAATARHSAREPR